MANPEHLKILGKGLDAWNQWRTDHPDLKPDLADADFNRAHLIAVDLHLARLSQADFRYANLEGANLQNAALT